MGGSLIGQTLANRYREDLAEDMPPGEYLALQAHVHRLSRALKHVLDAERIYVLSLGSRQGNSHLHFHVAPLPKGVPSAQQQFRIVRALETDAKPFFDLVRAHTMQGYYGSPRHGGNRDAVSWRMLGLDEPPLRGRAQYDLTAETKR